MLSKCSIFALFLCASAAIAGGCGSSSDSTPGALTKQQFAEQANDICRKARQERDAVIRQLLAKNGNKPALKRAEQEEVILKVVEPLSKMAEELGSLQLTRGAKAMVNSFDKTVAEIEANPSVALEGGGTEFAEAEKLASELGVKECASI
jgi:hypothetical protein